MGQRLVARAILFPSRKAFFLFLFLGKNTCPFDKSNVNPLFKEFLARKSIHPTLSGRLATRRTLFSHVVRKSSWGAWRCGSGVASS